MVKKTNLLVEWVVDGTGGQIQKNVLLSVKGGFFDKVRCLTENSPVPKGTVDLSGHTLLPGLVDAHVHLSMSGTEDADLRKKQLNNSFEAACRIMDQNTQKLLAHGVLDVRDGGDRFGHALRYKHEKLKEANRPICLYCAGKAWHKPGRYGSFVGRSLLRGTLAEDVMQDPSLMDHAKIIQSGLNSLRVFGKETPFQFALSELTDAVGAASRRGIKTMVHANGRNPVEIALKAGCHSIEHGFFMGSANLERMAEGSAFWIPTACTMKGFAESGKGLASEREMAMNNLEHQMVQIRRAKTLGVAVVLGTDSGSIGVHHGSAVIEEMKILMKSGFSLAETVRCASYNGARLLGQRNKGLVAQGMKADFIVVKGPPKELPESLNHIAYIHRDGQFQ